MDWFMLMVAGGLGAASRYGVGRLFPFTGSEFPTATVICNLSGSLVLALLVGRYAASHPQLVLIVGTGFGAWTTYSTFSLEMVRLASPEKLGEQVSTSLSHSLGVAQCPGLVAWAAASSGVICRIS